MNCVYGVPMYVYVLGVFWLFTRTHARIYIHTHTRTHAHARRTHARTYTNTHTLTHTQWVGVVVVRCMMIMMVVFIIIALFCALEHTHCAFVACDSK